MIPIVVDASTPAGVPGNYACSLCGEVFYSKRGTRKPGGQIFCSPEHRVQGQRYVVGIPHSKNKYDGKNTCATCGSEFQAIRAVKLYCSNKCRYDAGRQRAADRYANVKLIGATFSKKEASAHKHALLKVTKNCPLRLRDFTSMDTRQIHLDHSHDTGVIRGVLCFNCNSGLGQFKDDLPTLERAVEYLRAHKD